MKRNFGVGSFDHTIEIILCNNWSFSSCSLCECTEHRYNNMQCACAFSFTVTYSTQQSANLWRKLSFKCNKMQGLCVYYVQMIAVRLI